MVQVGAGVVQFDYLKNELHHQFSYLFQIVI